MKNNSFPVLRPTPIEHKSWDINTIRIKGKLPENVKVVNKLGSKGLVLVLSGGGMKALSQVGALSKLQQILKEVNGSTKSPVEINAVVASSGGNVTGCSVCSNWSIEKIRKESKRTIRWRNLLSRPDRFGLGFSSMEPIEQYARTRFVPIYNEFKKPLITLAYVNGKFPVIGWGKQPVGPWIRGACSAKFRVLPLKYKDYESGETYEMLDIGDFGSDWCNPVGIARYVFPKAKILSIDSSKSPKKPKFKLDKNIAVVRPYRGMSILQDFVNQIRANPNLAYRLGYEAIENSEEEIRNLF